MHLLALDIHSLDDASHAVDLAQTPAEIVFLSFSDSELRLVARLYEQDAATLPTLRCAPLAQLKHPYSVDLYLDRVARHAKLVVVRLLGGKDYWPYGVEQLAALARAQNFALAIIPGDIVDDPRLAQASTLGPEALDRLWSLFQDGGPQNLRSFIGFAATLIGRDSAWRESAPVASAGLYAQACRMSALDAPRALLAFYRAAFLADDAAPIVALADALRAQGFAVDAAFVASLKDPASAVFLRAQIGAAAPDVIVNATAFSARDASGGVLDCADAPVLQVALATCSREAWEQSPRGANGADLAMNVVLPEIDGRIFTRAISFKEVAPTRLASEFSDVRHAPDASRIAYVAALAANWARLRRKPNAQKQLALILSDYPARRGRSGYAIGLDAPASVDAIIEDLQSAGYDVGAACPLPKNGREDAPALMRALEDGAPNIAFPLTEYAHRFAALPQPFRDSVTAAWGAPDQDDACIDDAFRFACVTRGNLVIALQPDRGARAERRESYHDIAAAPRHSYIAFYLWLRAVHGVDAVIHLGAHGTLEWLPGKSTMLSENCAPECVLGPTPLIYPFIVNDPGEAAQAKRRAGAVAIGHMTPPLVDAGLYDAAAQIETLLDEYSAAATLDPRRAKLIAGAIVDEAERSGLSDECGVSKNADLATTLATLDAWLCDVKEMRIGDGLHVFARAIDDDANRLACANGEGEGLLAALSGRFVQPGPAGAPSRGRADVMPTGRNLYCIDPRHAPTRSACDIGKRAAREVMTRHAQEHGDWPRSLMLDLWGSATIRTGGEDFAQALALIGVAPVWDNASARVTGFEIEPMALRDFPRVDVTLHISGLFRDMFPGLIALFHDAARAVALLDEDDAVNPLRGAGAEVQRIFGAGAGSYGLGLSETLSRGSFEKRDDLARQFLDAAGNAYDRAGDATPARETFAARVAGADALVHVQDMAEVDVLTGTAFAEFEGGFAAASGALGGAARVLHLDATRSEALRVRTLPQEIARVLRGRLANPRWLEGQMRHGHRGAGEIAEGIDNLYAFAATTGCVSDAQFDLVYDATLGDDAVRDFLALENPRALEAIAHVFDEALRRGFWRTRRNSVGLALGGEAAQ
jgi:cobaltochelatase CobN